MSDPLYKPMADAIRALAMDAVQKANSGHPGMPMGMADVATVIWRKYLKFDAANPTWPDRDRFILSAGHGSMLLYALAYLTGFEKMAIDQIKNFRQLGALTAGHPEHDPELGIEMTTGPLGQGISTAPGFALAERILAARFGGELVDHNTFVICSDGDLMEGISHEACSLAGHMKLGRLIAYYDDNKISIDGGTELSFSEDVCKRFEAYGWHVQKIDGHDPAAIETATDAALAVTDKPSIIACRTTIGFGAPNKQGTSGCHGSPLGEDEVAATRKALGWEHEAFVIPEDILAAWREAGKRSAGAYEAWKKHIDASEMKGEFYRVMDGSLPAEAEKALDELKASLATEKPKKATRQSSGTVLAAVASHMPELVGGSADLSPSNNTKAPDMDVIVAPDYKGQYIHYGVREHGMAAIMNGLALHGGCIPYAGTFMQFADYSRPSIRLGALMKQRTIHVMTHDSIGLGEDGPTHQPVEHLAALRVIPNLDVYRPCDGIETAECWALALKKKTGPSLLALSRQGLPTLRGEGAENLCARGAYVLAEAEGERQITLLATGSEVMLAMQAREELAKEGVATAVVSVPCFSLFAKQDADYKAQVLGSAPRVAIEAGMSQGWDALLGEKGIFIGMKDFGASAPADQLYKHFGITAEAAVKAAKSLL